MVKVLENENSFLRSKWFRLDYLGTNGRMMVHAAEINELMN